MPSELDLKVMATLKEMTAPGQLLELAHAERFGVQMPLFKNAPGNLADFLAFFCAQNADKEFLVDGDIRLTFGEAYATARQLAGGLIEGHGVKKGDHIGLVGRNSANWIILYMAIAIAGGVTTKLNGFWQGDEIVDGINDVGCTIVFADAQRAKRIKNSGSEHNAKVVLFEHDLPPLEGLKAILENGGGAETPLPTIDPLDNATILFTSGSTGRSKGAYSDHRAVVQGAMSFVGAFAVVASIMEEEGTLPDIQPCALLCVPLFHVTASVPLLLVSFAIGRKIVLLNKWDAELAMQAMEKEKVTYFVGVPLMSMEIYTHPKRDQYDLSTCISVAAGGAPRPVEHVKRIKDAMKNEGFPIIGYGLTETQGTGASNQNENYMERPNSTGRATPPIVEIAILDDDGNQMPQGERGEVCIRSICNFSGYWNNEEATKAAFTQDGYFRSGDIGYLDEEQFLFIVDRKKDIIIRGGENISCQEVEDAAYSHPAIAEASVFGVEDERFGEVPAMVYHLKPAQELSQDDLTAFLGERLAAFKVPTHLWEHETPLPRLGTAKIDKISVAKKHRDLLAETG